ncbi:MAG: family 65 glycosyl hydrolase [Micromonosporaceae bacterium]|nr:family 65 glycosyl hydrolase [Micromonosporaceae bacterium]
MPVERLDAVVFALDGVLVDAGPASAGPAAARDQVSVCADALALIARLHELGLSMAAVTSNRSGRQVLEAAGLDEWFTVVVDGRDADRRGEAVERDPALLLSAARLLRAHPARCAVVDATMAGVLAGCRGGFGLVVGVDRHGGQAADLRKHGADEVLPSLNAVTIDQDATRQRWWQRREPTKSGNGPAGWLLDYTGYDPQTEGVRETLCAVGNGYLATRAAAPETSSAPVHYPGTYIAGIFNRLTSCVHGHVHEDESLVKLPNWLILRWRIDGERWVVPDGPGISDYRQSLDLRAGVLHRRYRYVDDRGRATTVVSRMFASTAQPHLAVLETTFIAENWSGTVQVRSGIDGRVANRQVAQYAPLAGRHLEPDGQGRDGPGGLWLRMRTSQSRLTVATATRLHLFRAGTPIQAPRRLTTVTARLEETYTIPIHAGEPVRVLKLAAYYTSRDHAITEPATAARQAIARADSFPQLLTAHVHAWRRLWERSHVYLTTNTPETMLALHLHTFHVLASTPTNDIDLDAGIGARGLHGEGYRGHVFWDELFVHRFLVLHLPEASRALLLYRWRRLGAARRAAAAVGCRGAMFPWESGSDGREETPDEIFNPRTGRWLPDRTAYERHIGLAIGYSVWQYYQATGDLTFLRDYGAELIVEIARFFADLAHENARTGRYEITGVVGPDELHDAYPDSSTPGVANNAYTNLMTVWLLRRALEVTTLLACDNAANPTDAFGVTDEERARWRDITTRMYVPWHDEQIISQFDGYADLKPFDLSGYLARYGNIGQLHLILAEEGDSANRYQVGKQADVLMLLYLLSAEELRDLLADLGYPWPPEALPRTVRYYVNRVSHGSTLSRVVHAWVEARTDRAASWQSFRQALAVDIHDTRGGTTREGIHLGAMAGTLDLVERCYLGLETRQDALWLNPRLPRQITTLHTLITYRGLQIHIAVTQQDLTLTASPCNVAPVTVHVDGQPPARLTGGQEITFPLKPNPRPELEKPRR